MNIPIFGPLEFLLGTQIKPGAPSGAFGCGMDVISWSISLNGIVNWKLYCTCTSMHAYQHVWISLMTTRHGGACTIKLSRVIDYFKIFQSFLVNEIKNWIHSWSRIITLLSKMLLSKTNNPFSNIWNRQFNKYAYVPMSNKREIFLRFIFTVLTGITIKLWKLITSTWHNEVIHPDMHCGNQTLVTQVIDTFWRLDCNVGNGCWSWYLPPIPRQVCSMREDESIEDAPPVGDL